MPTTNTIVLATVGTLATGILGYAIYFDHRRRTDPNFRKSLKKEVKKQARAAREQAELDQKREREFVKIRVAEAKEDGFPHDSDEKESYFMVEVEKGERLQADGSNFEAALCFYKALKVYPSPADLITIYDKTVSKPVLDLLAEMIAADEELQVGPFAGSASDSGIAGVPLD
ncbi:hypothetical protein HYALB_00010541 [Hymenoscyphus albidus]|uniref:Mitochondrial import receptor subunit TOM20 n=1 Tax=Hymenoscyphus albidus TaxID=595503 RepID=A0A9N9LW30_9HELO|nr:hypothetical protein HYALB_00010541 [Hymenoscyphus albidus]